LSSQFAVAAVNDSAATEVTNLLAQIKVGVFRTQSALYSCTIVRSMMVRYVFGNDVGIDIAGGSGAANVNAHSKRQRCRRHHVCHHFGPRFLEVSRSGDNHIRKNICMSLIPLKISNK